MKARRRSKVSDEQKFVVSVWWMHGWTVGAISRWSGMTTGQVRGLVHRRFKDQPRDDLTIEQRQGILDALLVERADGGRLKDAYFKAGPVNSAPRSQIVEFGERKRKDHADDAPMPSWRGDRWLFDGKPVEEAQETPVFDLATVKGRREARKWSSEQRRKKDAAAVKAKAEAEKREQGHAEKRGDMAAALEWLNSRRVLADPIGLSSARAGSDGSGVRRWQAGSTLRALFDAVRVGDLTSVDFERSGSGSSNGGRTVAAYKLEAIHMLGKVRRMVASVDGAGMDLLEAVVDRDEFVWDGIDARRDREAVFERVRRALDVVAVVHCLMPIEAFQARWKAIPIDLDQDGERREAMSMDAAREIARLAREMARTAG